MKAAKLISGITRQLFTPLNYLRINHESKFYYDFWIPLTLSILAVTVGWLLPFEIDVFGTNGIVASGNGLLQILTGFYIAALAAVSTFNSKTIEENLEGGEVTLVEKVGNEVRISVLNRRRFLSLLFGYLAFVSLALYALGSVANVLAPGVTEMTAKSFALPIRQLFLGVYTFLSANVFTTTLLGLYYLSYRLHLPVRRHTATKDQEDASSTASAEAEN